MKLNPQITRFIGRAGLQLQKHSPEILMGVGVIGFITTVVMASKATLKLKPIIADHQDSLEEIDLILNKELLDDKKDTESRSLERAYARSIATVYLNTAKELTLLYGPSLLIGVGTLGSFFGAYGVMTSRNASLTAAYSVVQTTFNEYRKRVIAEKGEEVDKKVMRGIAEDVKNKKIKKKHKQGDYDSPYAVFFDEYSIFYKRDPYYNLTFLKNQQNYANDILRARGHVFLNEVFDMLGLPHTAAGALCGWVYSRRDPDDHVGDNYIDFGISIPKNNSFVIGQEPSVLLDFNVDGEIWDLI